MRLGVVFSTRDTISGSGQGHEKISAKAAVFELIPPGPGLVWTFGIHVDERG